MESSERVTLALLHFVLDSTLHNVFPSIFLFVFADEGKLQVEHSAESHARTGRVAEASHPRDAHSGSDEAAQAQHHKQDRLGTQVSPTNYCFTFNLLSALFY